MIKSISRRTDELTEKKKEGISARLPFERFFFSPFQISILTALVVSAFGNWGFGEWGEWNRKHCIVRGAFVITQQKEEAETHELAA